MKPYIRYFLCLVIGFVVGAFVTQSRNLERVEISDRSLTRMNDTLISGSYPQLQAAATQARLAMRLYSERSDEARVRELCAEALATFLSVSEESKQRGDLDFMESIIDSNREAVDIFLNANPELRRNEK